MDVFFYLCLLQAVLYHHAVKVTCFCSHPRISFAHKRRSVLLLWFGGVVQMLGALFLTFLRVTEDTIHTECQGPEAWRSAMKIAGVGSRLSLV